MINYDELISKCKEYGFTHAVPLDCATLTPMTEVRDMCAANRCGQYGSNWSCPPACGELEECIRKMEGFSRGILVQTVGYPEDSMDFETMMETEQQHKEHFLAFADYLTEVCPGRLALGSGCCTRCKTCAYPDAPCRFPDRMVSSMEAYGLLVTQVCESNNIPYYYGPGTIAYVSCYLLE